MHLRVVLALASIALTTAALPAAPGSIQAHPAGSNVLALRFARGEVIVEHADVVDRVNWILPPARLQAFRDQGFVVQEETRTQLAGTGLVTSLTEAGASVKSSITVTVRDVPRKTISVARDHGVVVITSANTQRGNAPYSIEDAPMIGLPLGPVSLGSRWTTSQRVSTTLGSGTCRFEHVVAAFDGSRIRIDVTGAGTITGKEYNLPRLLPGTISVSGSAWFDETSGLIVQESYHIENTLVKTLGTERIGFTEALDADTDVHKEPPAAKAKD